MIEVIKVIKSLTTLITLISSQNMLVLCISYYTYWVRYNTSFSLRLLFLITKLLHVCELY